ncbi:MAG: ASPIC/UnbV domain-containing protein [Planctomycetota bacterium]
MARPTKRFGDLDAYGEVDEQRQEFWVEDIWNYPADKNLSGYEPNQVLWNRGGMEFDTLTYVCGAGHRGDGRAVLFADVDGDLAPDLIVRQASMGPIRVYRNRFPPKRRLILELEGTKSNRRGVGTRVEVHTGNEVVTRELYPANNFHGQQAARLHFGLGGASRVKIVLHWPSGLRQELTDVATDRFLRIREGSDEIEVVREKRNG